MTPDLWGCQAARPLGGHGAGSASPVMTLCHRPSQGRDASGGGEGLRVPGSLGKEAALEPQAAVSTRGDRLVAEDAG